MNTNSAFNRSYTKNLFGYQKFDLRQVRVFGGGQAVVHFDAADKGCLYVAKMKAMNFQDDILTIPFDNFKNH